jgi:hypothetical protein
LQSELLVRILMMGLSLQVEEWRLVYFWLYNTLLVIHQLCLSIC